MLLREQVELTPLALCHAERMFRWVCDPTVSTNIGLRSVPSLEATVRWINAATANPAVRPFAILLEGQHVGNVVLDRIDPHVGSARLSIYIGDHAARGAGVGKTGVALALREAFEVLALNKVWLTVHSRNMPAIKAYMGLGFALEGILREEHWVDGERISALQMSMLKPEFFRLARVLAESKAGGRA
jgi:RimJ/RimL family protein N-acetyltransferase